MTFVSQKPNNEKIPDEVLKILKANLPETLFIFDHKNPPGTYLKGYTPKGYQGSYMVADLVFSDDSVLEHRFKVVSVKPSGVLESVGDYGFAQDGDYVFAQGGYMFRKMTVDEQIQYNQKYSKSHKNVKGNDLRLDEPAYKIPTIKTDHPHQ